MQVGASSGCASALALVSNKHLQTTFLLPLTAESGTVKESTQAPAGYLAEKSEHSAVQTVEPVLFLSTFGQVNQTMIERYVGRLLVLLLSSQLFSTSGLAQAPFLSADATAAALSGSGAGKGTNVFHPVTPGPIDGQIAQITARMLERFQYLRQPFNDAVSSKFLDRYIEMFDPQHLHFLQSDLAQFEGYRTNLDHLTLPARGTAPDTRPACEIFNRFVERLQQRVAYADDLLRNDQFTFDTDERVVLNRKDLPFPKDLAEAKKLWRERLRAEYLQEKLGKIGAKKTVAATALQNGGKTSVPDSAADAALNLPVTAGSSTNQSGELKKTESEQIVETLSHRYHRNLHTFMDWDNDDVLQIYLTALAHVYDPHSDYFNRSQLDSFAIGMNLSLLGIGAELTSEDGYCTIHRLLPGGPAAKSNKLKENDKIIAVAQSNQPPVDVVDMSLSKAVQLIRGPKGTEVRLTIVPAGADSAARTILTLVRDEIKLEDQEAKAKIIELPSSGNRTLRLGVIDLPSFYASFDPSNTRGKNEEPRSTTEDVRRLLSKLKQENVSGVILDLRRNGGGSLEEAINLTGLFIKDGPVVLVKDYDGTVQEDDDRDSSIFYDGPLIVLTSRFSASASEILAGALQDYGRALIVGDSSTHGKGTVQSVQPLGDALTRMGVRGLTNDPGALKVTIKKFYRASGASTQLKGVVPDIVLPSILSESTEIGEKALENPLPWDTIRSAKFDHLNRVDPFLADLRKRSAERIATDKEFGYIREDIQLFKKQQADKTISLDEKARLKEKEEADARLKARDKERLARQDQPEKTYEITLKLAKLPGLPPPLAKTNSTIARISSGKNGPVAIGGTNSTAAVAKETSATSLPLDGELDEDKPPAVDAPLIESEHILVDYLSLLSKGNLATTGPTPAR
jgi:carboxyl-terminal processing protease